MSINNSDMNIIPLDGRNFSKNELKRRLKMMGVNLENFLLFKTYNYVEVYNEHVNKNQYKKRIIHLLREDEQDLLKRKRGREEIPFALVKETNRIREMRRGGSDNRRNAILVDRDRKYSDQNSVEKSMNLYDRNSEDEDIVDIRPDRNNPHEMSLRSGSGKRNHNRQRVRNLDISNENKPYRDQASEDSRVMNITISSHKHNNYNRQILDTPASQDSKEEDPYQNNENFMKYLERPKAVEQRGNESFNNFRNHPGNLESNTKIVTKKFIRRKPLPIVEETPRSNNSSSSISKDDTDKKQIPNKDLGELEDKGGYILRSRSKKNKDYNDHPSIYIHNVQYVRNNQKSRSNSKYKQGNPQAKASRSNHRDLPENQSTIRTLKTQKTDTSKGNTFTQFNEADHQQPKEFSETQFMKVLKDNITQKHQANELLGLDEEGHVENIKISNAELTLGPTKRYFRVFDDSSDQKQHTQPGLLYIRENPTDELVRRLNLADNEREPERKLSKVIRPEELQDNKIDLENISVKSVRNEDVHYSSPEVPTYVQAPNYMEESRIPIRKVSQARSTREVGDNELQMEKPIIEKKNSRNFERVNDRDNSRSSMSRNRLSDNSLVRRKSSNIIKPVEVLPTRNFHLDHENPVRNPFNNKTDSTKYIKIAGTLLLLGSAGYLIMNNHVRIEHLDLALRSENLRVIGFSVGAVLLAYLTFQYLTSSNYERLAIGDYNRLIEILESEENLTTIENTDSANQLYYTSGIYEDDIIRELAISHRISDQEYRDSIFPLVLNIIEEKKTVNFHWNQSRRVFRLNY